MFSYSVFCFISLLPFIFRKENEWIENGTCCTECTGQNLEQQKELCKQNCTIQGDNSQSRYLSSEIGYHLKFHFDENGLPQGCTAFEGERNEKWYRDNGWRLYGGSHGCPLQDYKDEHGIPMHEAVELYGQDGDLWINDFIRAFGKMQQNGNYGLQVGPSLNWAHRA